MSAYITDGTAREVKGHRAATSSQMSRQTPLSCPGHTRPVVYLHYSGVTPNGFYFISACKDGKPMLRQGDTGDWIGTYEGHKGAVWGACLNRDATRAATGAADFTVKLWNAMSGDELKTFTHKHIVKVVDFSEDSRYLLSGCNDKNLRLFDLRQLDSDPQVLSGGKSAIRAAVWCKEPSMLVSCGEEPELNLWDSRSGTIVKTFSLESVATSIELSWDRELLTVAHGKRVTIVDATSFEKVKTLFVPLAYSATLHPTRKWVVTGGDDLKLYKFDYEEEREVESYKGHFGPIHCVRYSPDGEVYCSGSEDGTIRLWQNSVGRSYGLWRSAEEAAAVSANAATNSS